jgi:putative ribosome biogenesis GTPase RsgA
MEALHTRYPGAQPFSDDDIARAVFFGRTREATALADQIIGNRLIVVYAKSGLGKTSLLNAGVSRGELPASYGESE